RAEQAHAVHDRVARAAQDARGLAVRGLGDERAEQIEMELGQLQAVVEAEGLQREAAPAGLAQETRHAAAVAGAEEVALVLPEEGLAERRWAVGVRAARR